MCTRIYLYTASCVRFYFVGSAYGWLCSRPSFFIAVNILPFSGMRGLQCSLCVYFLSFRPPSHHLSRVILVASLVWFSHGLCLFAIVYFPLFACS